MLTNPPPTRRDRILGGLWGSVVGDALGVPVEFQHRDVVQVNPVADMRGFGTHNQPPGTWSDDSSLLLCSTESLIAAPFDLRDMGQRFLRWYNEGLWTPHGHVFDIGATTRAALRQISHGVAAELAGGNTPSSNGNGSLMRILPVALRFHRDPEALPKIHLASAITHRHLRAQMACGFFTLIIRELLDGDAPTEAYLAALEAFHAYYSKDSASLAELNENFLPLLTPDLAARHQLHIESGGYVLDTLVASVWCLLTTTTFEQCVLKAVNLGSDTDTTGCVAGGLAGVHYGLSQVPPTWINTLAKGREIETLFNRFAELVTPNSF